jgi:hypothetical protein
MSAVECPNCASSVPAASRFCPECGRPLAETSSADSARSSWPPDAPLVVVVLVAVGGVILLVGGRWAWGLAVLLLAGLVFLSQREVERRAASTKLFALRDRLSAHREVVSARSRGQLDLFRARRELAELEADRARAFQNLGRAVFEDDETGIKGGRTALTGLVERITRKEAEIETLIQETDERVRRAQAHVVPTAKMESPPEPARVPEPWPPPDEGEPPEPAPVPEPSPGDPAPTPEHPPMPETRAADRRR